MGLSPTLSAASINAAASVYTETWSVPVVPGAAALRTLQGTTGGVTVGALQSGSGTATLTFALSPLGGVYAADTVLVGIAADSVENALNATPNLAVVSHSVANGSAVTPPAAPTGLATIPGEATVRVTWGNVAGAVSYRLYRATVASGTNPATGGAVIGTPEGPGFDDRTATPGVTYYYSVSGVDGFAQEGARSAEASATSFVPASFGRTSRAERAGRFARVG